MEQKSESAQPDVNGRVVKSHEILLKAEYDAYINEHFPQSLSLMALAEQLGTVADSDSIPFAKKEYIVFNVVRNLGHQRCVRAIESPIKRGLLIARLAVTCANSIGAHNETAYYILSTLLNTKPVVVFDCARIATVFATYQRTPADFDPPGRWVGEIFTFAKFRGTRRLPDITTELLTGCLEELAKAYPENIARRA